MSNTAVPIVAIVGRPNVGKSALFNRLVKKRQSLVDATPGLTRDRLYGDLTWRGMAFQVVDTGGLQFDKNDRFSATIGRQVDRAMQEARIALFVCDARTGSLPLDHEVARWIRRWGKPVLLVANKVDTEIDFPSIFEFSSLGLGEPMPVSSLHGLRVGELLDAIVQELKKSGAALREQQETQGASIRIAIVGRPNVGKSSLVNRILDEDRVLVDDRPGTTRDPVEADLTYQGRAYQLIDTAGIVSHRRLKLKIDAVTRLKSLDVIRRADACLGVLDASVGIVKDDLKLLDAVISSGRPLCLAVNKWDLVPKGTDPRQVTGTIARAAPFLRFAPVICTSAKTGLNVLKALEKTAEAAKASAVRIKPADADRLLEMVKTDPRAPVAFRNAHLFRLIQVGTAPPTFHLLGRMKYGFRPSDVAYLENLFRRELDLEGTPVEIRLLTNNR